MVEKGVTRLTKEKEITVAIIDALGKHAGMHYYTEQMAGGLQNRGANALLYITSETNDGSVKPYFEAFVFDNLYNDDPAWRRGARFFRGLLKAIVSARSYGASVVIVHLFNFNSLELASVWLSRLAGMRVVLTVHDVEKFGVKGHSKIRKLIMRGSSGQIVHNQFSLVKFQSFDANVTAPTVVIPHGHYCDAFPELPSRSAARERLGLPKEEIEFLFFGNPRAEKGLDLLLEGCARIKNLPGWKLIVAGKMKSDMESHYKGLVAKLELCAHVRMDIRHISDEDAVCYYRAANLVVVPYYRIYESGVTIMSMSLERAVLVSDLQPLVESVDGGHAGMIFPSENAEALADALRAALQNPGFMDEIGRRGRERVVARRGWNEIGEKTIEFLQVICG